MKQIHCSDKKTECDTLRKYIMTILTGEWIEVLRKKKEICSTKKKKEKKKKKRKNRHWKITCASWSLIKMLWNGQMPGSCHVRKVSCRLGILWHSIIWPPTFCNWVTCDQINLMANSRRNQFEQFTQWRILNANDGISWCFAWFYLFHTFLVLHSLCKSHDHFSCKFS